MYYIMYNMLFYLYSTFINIPIIISCKKKYDKSTVCYFIIFAKYVE